MFVDARNIDCQKDLDTDVCVIGGGAAGIALAGKLGDAAIRVSLIDSGGLNADRDDSRIYRVVDDRSPRLVRDVQRGWFFGGNTNHWPGNCRPLDTSDFAARDWIPYSGWPIGHRELLPYYARARAFCGLRDLPDVERDARGNESPVEIDPAILEHKIVETCPEPRFARLYDQRLEASDDVRIYLHARVVRLETNAAGDVVTAADCRSSDGRRVRIAARVFVLAAGGIENPRLLLSSNAAAAAGLANGNGLVGRFFMEHPFADIPLGRGEDRHLASLHREQTRGKRDTWPQLSLSEHLMRSERLNALGLWIDRPLLPWRAGRDGVEALLSGKPRPLRSWLARAHWLREAAEAARFVGGKLAGDHCLRVMLEQTPDPDNRIEVSAERDRLGQPEARLTFRMTEEDRRRHCRGVRLAANAIGLDGPRIERDLERCFEDGRIGFFWHHMGTTRMHADPRHGVVDRNCRAHTVSNLFIAGSSVFPTGGAAPPTLTIVALAIRLAEHVATEWFRQ
jgi:choline dehydrogenase-like flavoprotein